MIYQLLVCDEADLGGWTNDYWKVDPNKSLHRIGWEADSPEKAIEKYFEDKEYNSPPRHGNTRKYKFAVVSKEDGWQEYELEIEYHRATLSAIRQINEP